MIGCAEGSLGKGEDGVDVIFLNPDRRIAHIIERNVTEGMTASLIIGDMTILSPAAIGQSNGGSPNFLFRFSSQSV